MKLPSIDVESHFRAHIRSAVFTKWCPQSLGLLLVARTPVANHDEQIGYIDDAVLVDVCR